MKASPGARSWIAAGVRHELLTRALPALRHHMVAPVSVVRMGLLLLKRQVAAPDFDTEGCAQRIGAIDEQVSLVVEGIRSLRDWELAGSGGEIRRSALVAQCAGLLRTPFELSGIALDIDPALEPQSADAAAAAAAGAATTSTSTAAGTEAAAGAAEASQEPAFAGAPALRYLMLGALSHLHDCVPQLRQLRVEADGDAALCVRAISGRQEGEGAADGPKFPEAEVQRAHRALAIDAVALQSLADEFGYPLTLERDTVRFGLRTG